MVAGFKAELEEAAGHGHVGVGQVVLHADHVGPHAGDDLAHAGQLAGLILQGNHQIGLADIREIAAMKIKAITQEEPRQKDFWDIYELNNTYSLKEMIEWAMMRDEWSFTKNDIKAGFERIFDVKECPEGIDCYRGYAWELISMDLKAAAEEYFNQEKD